MSRILTLLLTTKAVTDTKINITALIVTLAQAGHHDDDEDGDEDHEKRGHGGHGGRRHHHRDHNNITEIVDGVVP